jgi:hypothetical protein
MTEARIPFLPLQESGMDSLGGASPLAMNVVVTGKGVLERRPGIVAAPGIISSVISQVPVYGLFQSMDGTVYAVGGEHDWGRSLEDMRIWGSYENSMGIVGDEGDTATIWFWRLSGGRRPVFCEYGGDHAVIAVASGGVLQDIREKFTFGWIGAGTVIEEESVPQSTHVTSMSQRLIANELRWNQQRVRYSGLPSDTYSYATWTEGIGTAGSFTAENAPDPVVAVDRTREYLFVFGTKTVQLFAPDPTWTFAPILTLPVGCVAPYSIVGCEYWIDDRKRVVKYADGGVVSISAPIQSALDSMTVDDAFGYRAELGAMSCLVWTFPTDGRTFVYQEGLGWGQWSTRVNGKPKQFMVSCHHRSQTTSLNLVGTDTGRIGRLDQATQTDFGAAIEAKVFTGFVGHDTLRMKRCLRVSVILRRGRSSPTPSKAMLAYRDREGPWEAKIPIDFGAPGDTDATLTFYSLGVYNQRQWMFEFLGPERLSLVSAIEEYEVL